MLAGRHLLGKSQWILLPYGVKKDELCEIVETLQLHSGGLGVAVLTNNEVSCGHKMEIKLVLIFIKLMYFLEKKHLKNLC